MEVNSRQQLKLAENSYEIEMLSTDLQQVCCRPSANNYICREGILLFAIAALRKLIVNIGYVFCKLAANSQGLPLIAKRLQEK